MSMTLSDVEQAVEEARRTIARADTAASQMARLVAGRLRKSGVSHQVLCELKRELADYNMHTRRWK